MLTGAKRIALTLLLPLALPSLAIAIPSRSNSTIPKFIRVVGSHDGAPDTAGVFHVIVHDVADVPVAGSEVVLDFSACPDIRLCSEAVPGQIVDCASATVQMTTDLYGEASFIVLGAGTNQEGGAGAPAGAVRVTASGALMEDVTANVLDENGAVAHPGMDAGDVAAWIRDLGNRVYVGRSDFNQDGKLSGVDLAVWLALFARGGSTSGCASASYCP